MSTPSSDDDSRDAIPVTSIGLHQRNWVRAIDDPFESDDPMNIHQLHFGDSDGSGSGDEAYGSSGGSTVVKNIGSSYAIAQSSHHSEEQDSESAENPSVNFEDDAQYTNSSGGEDSDVDPINEFIYESAEDIECGSEDMSLSSGDDSDATNQLDVNHMNICDLFFTDLEAYDLSDTDFDPAAQSTAESEDEDSFEGSNGPSDEESDATVEPDPSNMSIRDLFHADLEVDHPSDGEFDAASETTNDSEENMDNSGNSNDGDSDDTDNLDATAMTLLELMLPGDIDDRSSDEEYQPADEGIDEVREGSESDKENTEEEVRLHSFFLS